MNRRVCDVVVAMLLVATPVTAGATSSSATQPSGPAPTWHLHVVAHPAARSAAAVAYDASVGRAVLFGGEGVSHQSRGDSWTWAEGWKQVPGAAPAPRQHTTMTYDAASKQVVLFGGDGPPAGTAETGDQAADATGVGTWEYGHVAFGDTWTWKGGSWSQFSGSGPPARSFASMVYDAASRQIVLFGGSGAAASVEQTTVGAAAGLLADTWTWDGTRWTQHQVPGPPARQNASMVYDSATRTVVLFGGIGSGGALSDTWTWNGKSWSRHTTTGPSPRWDAAMTDDPAAHDVVLFGGWSGEPTSLMGIDPSVPVTVGETWTWDGKRWSRRTAHGPGSRAGAVMVYDGTARDVLLFGGGTGSGTPPFGDSWIWNGHSWRQLPGTAPDARYLSSGFYSPRDRGVVLVGGVDAFDRPYDDTWVWSRHGWRSNSDPPQRESMTVLYDAALHRPLMYGGTDTARATYPNVPLGWTGGHWSTFAEGPAPRTDYSLVYDDALRALVMFGGQQVVGTVVPRDTWLFTGSTWKLGPIAGPPARADASMAYDAATHQVVLFGGRAATFADGNQTGPTGTEYLGDTWTFDGRRWSQWQGQGGPDPQAGALVTYDAAARQVVLFGRTTAGDGGTWVWSGHGWSKDNGPGPSSRSDASLVYDAAHRNVVLFGGQAGNGGLDDTWTWNGHGWLRRTASGPEGRSGASLAYDSTRRTVVLFGGQALDTNGSGTCSMFACFRDLDDTWTWDGSAWHQQTGAAPPARRGAALVDDPVTGQLVLFGGLVGSGPLTAEGTWTWGTR